MRSIETLELILDDAPSALPGARRFSSRHIVLPIYPSLNTEHMELISVALHKVLGSPEITSQQVEEESERLLRSRAIRELCDGLFIFLR
jgi:hypothetical protein